MPSSLAMAWPVDPEPLAQPGVDRERPGGVHLQAERRVQHAPASRRARRGSARPAGCGRAGRGRWPPAARPGTRPGCRPPRRRAPPRGSGRPRPAASAPDSSRTNAPSACPSSAGRPSVSPFQNGSRPGWPGAGTHHDPVVGDVLDPPAAGAEREHVADAGLVDHLLVELADPPAGRPVADEEHPEQPAVGDGAAGGDRQPLRARTAAEPSGHPVPDDAGPQLGELLARVAAGEQVEGGLVGRRAAAWRTAPPGGPARRPRRRRARRSTPSPRPAGRARRAGWRAPTAPRSRRRASARRSTAACSRSARCLGSTTPRETSPTWWPARPTRCMPLATDGGASTCTTRSTAPMSMPSSRLLVATTQGSRPDLRSSSIRARCSLLTEPWWARASRPPAPAGRAGLGHHLRRHACVGAARRRRGWRRSRSAGR